jgi:hypothetical protein
MDKPNDVLPFKVDGDVVPLGTGVGDVCSIVTFATACGIPVDEVVELLENGTLPSISTADARMVNVALLRADLLSGKDTYAEGDYSHD